MKSDYGLPANSGSTQQQISEEERIFRWKYGFGEYPGMEPTEFNEKIEEIRKRTGKP